MSKLKDSIKIKDIKAKFLPIKSIFKVAFRIHKIAFKISKTAYIIILVGISIGAILPIINSYASGRVIDELINALNINSGINDTLLLTLALYLGILVTERLINTVRTYFEDGQWMELVGHFTIEIQKSISKLDAEHLDDPKLNDKIQKVSDSFAGRIPNFLNTTYYLLSDMITIPSTLFVILTFSPVIGLIILFTIVPNFITDIIFGKKKWGIYDADAEIRRNFWHTTDYLGNTNNLFENKVFNTKSYLINKIRKIFFEFHEKQKHIDQKRNVYSGLTSVIATVGFGACYIIVINQVLNGSISIGTFTFYIATIRTFSSSMSSLLTRFSRIFENGLYVIDIFDVIDTNTIIKNGNIKIDKNRPPKIEFKNVSFKYPNTDKYIYQNLNFTINPGENIALVGKNGAGKTTFVNMLCRFYDVTEGEILINGHNLKTLDLKNWYSTLAFLNQNFIKYHFDVKTNIGIGNVSDINNLKKIKSSAILSGADEFVQKYDNKYNQILSKKFTGGTEPSAGQWQKIALARAFFKDSPVLILDEPTSAIDPKSEYEIFEKLFDFAKEKTVIIISHRFSTVRNASKIIVIDEGKIIEQGTHQELISIDGEYKKAYEMQKRGYQD